MKPSVEQLESRELAATIGFMGGVLLVQGTNVRVLAVVLPDLSGQTNGTVAVTARDKHSAAYIQLPTDSVNALVVWTNGHGSVINTTGIVDFVNY